MDLVFHASYERSNDTSAIKKERKNKANLWKEYFDTGVVLADPLSNFDLDEYSSILNKIWVLNDWDGGAYSENYSVFISKIEDGIIEGKLVIGRIAEPDFFEYSFSSNTDYLPIRGIINDNIAKCEFSNEDGKSNLNIKFLNNNQIEVTIEYIHTNKNSSNLLQNGTNLFIPYNLSIYTSFIINEDHTIKTNLKSWQNAILVSGEIEEDNGSKIYPMMFLVDEENNILYNFKAPFLVGTKITNVSLEDLNDDGLKDIKVVCGFFNYDTGDMIVFLK
ncbi:hypothetical protein LJC58_09320 [Lachnospiraceae bacterium OttesenSCG-928-D06]|nr:hypothetical protein [Lachnospiraceae bacterium OttesenSCG-928-D06]